MDDSHLLDPVQILYGSNQPVVEDAVLIDKGHLIGFGDLARDLAKGKGINPKPSKEKLLAPCLVDPHSVLEEPINGLTESLRSIRKAAANAGYGQIALLPRSSNWRDKSELLRSFNDPLNDVTIHLWGSFSKGGEGKALSPHADLIEHGAIGLAEDDYSPPIDLLKQGLLLGEMGNSPLLFAPRDKNIQGDGIVREGVETLRAGWVPDPLASETLPLTQLLELQKLHPERSIRLMNLSTKDGVSILAKSSNKPLASVFWWHLVTDRAALNLSEIGWRVSPSIGSPQDRKALIKALKDKTLNAVAVHSIPLNEEETEQPLDQRPPGLSGHQLVLSALWQELVVKSNFSIEELWEALSFGPSKLLNAPEENLYLGSKRWLLFDPNKHWIQDRFHSRSPLAANQPWQGRNMLGKVVACGLKYSESPTD